MPALTFQNVSKYFQRHGGQMLLRDRISHLLRASRRERFYALRDLSFSVEPGDSVGIVGSNGAGKSTLLSLATRLCFPSEGQVIVKGRIAALLELGSGFHPDLTGAENVRINGALLGLNRAKLRTRFDEIVEFSGVGEFIDEPLRTYSSGMMMRLAFAVAIHVEPDILIIDEVLGVGDEAFFNKCFDRILEFRRAGKTILCVSHSLEKVRLLCNQAIWLEHGRLKETGPAEQVIDSYTEFAELAACGAGEARTPA